MIISPLAAPWLILLAVLLYSTVHSLLASSQAKAWAQRRLGKFGERGYRLFFNIFAGITLIPLLGLSAMLPDETLYSIPAPWVYLTTVIQGLAALMLLIGLFQTGIWSFLGLRQLMDTNPESQQKMVIKGLYRYVRHPLYTAGLIYIWLTPVMTINHLSLYIGFSLYLIIGALIEERKLQQYFGDEYKEYKVNTPMLIPGIRLPYLD
jgi:protein-S-isoprenylcysteine O-methyltransferase Ste14